MDNYPEHLAPEIDERGAIVTPFEVWWAKVAAHFSNVPEDLARTWLHEHWGQSRFGSLKASQYTFELIQWPVEEIGVIKTGQFNFEVSNASALRHGHGLIELQTYPTAEFMRSNLTFPAAIVVVDNRDGHIEKDYEGRHVPAVVALVEGHRRFHMSLALAEQGRLRDRVPVWVMRRAEPTGSSG